jgi:hypothetical protein
MVLQRVRHLGVYLPHSSMGRLSNHGGSVFVSAHNELQKDFPAFSGEDFEFHVIDKYGAPHLSTILISQKCGAASRNYPHFAMKNRFFLTLGPILTQNCRNRGNKAPIIQRRASAEA